jgi:hypothetical protein
LFNCFVNVSEDDEFDFYLVPSADVARHLRERRKYKESKGLKENGKWRWFRFGKQGNAYKDFFVPIGEDYRTAWDKIFS